MQQIKYNGVLYNVYARGENPNWPDYESITFAETGANVKQGQRKLAKKFIEINGEIPNPNSPTTHVWIRQLLNIF